MSTKARATSPSATGAKTVPLQPFALNDLARQQFAASTEMMSVLMQGLEAMRGLQQEAAQQAGARQQAAVRKFTGQKGADVFNQATDLASLEVEAAARFWQEFSAVVIQTQMKMGECASRLFGVQGDNPIQTAMAIWQSPFAASID